MQRLHASRGQDATRRLIAGVLAVALGAFLAIAPATPAHAAPLSSTIDFESGLSSGDTPSTLAVGAGMSGASLGTVAVSASNPQLPGNAAMVFDSTCGGQTVPHTDPTWDPTMCSDDDPDLYVPAQGNTLIITENGDSSEPDDYAGRNGVFTFDFSSWGPGTVTWERLTVIDLEDTEGPEEVRLFDPDGILIATVPIAPTGGDNTSAVTSGPVTGVALMEVMFNGSGAVDDIVITTEIPIIDLELTKTVDDSAVTVGDTVTFTIELTNQGPDPATGVAVTDTLPTGLSYVSDNGAGAYDSATGVWTVGDLGVGATVSLQLTVTVDDAGTFVNEAEVTAANEDDIDSTPGDGTGDDWDDEPVTATRVLASGLIGDTVWFDDDKDGIEDAGEKGVAGVTITLTNNDTNAVSTQVTNADGKYLFAALDPGNYTVRINTATTPEMTVLTTVGSFTIDLGLDEQYLTADFGIAAGLPATGMEIHQFALVGALLLLTGAALLFGARTRERGLI